LRNGHALEPSTARAEGVAVLAETFQLLGIENPGREARMVVCAASGVSQAELIIAPEEPLGSAAPRIREFAMRRAAGEPLSRIVGKREFRGLALAISPQVLDPRPETESIVDAAISILRDRRDELLRILDLGVGSGSLLCALLTEFPIAHGVGVDISIGAANMALGNLEGCGLSQRAKIQVGDWTRGLEGRFDMIVSNPPYIPTAELPRLRREVRDFDPWVALDGGFDGLAAFRRIIPEARSRLSSGGWFVAEFGAGQAADVTAIAKQCGFADPVTYKDLAGLNRVVAARL
jgi:release factor glutamine methyltransferase